MQEVRPKKSLGQHFLTDMNIAQRIVEQLSPDVESVIEGVTRIANYYGR